MGEQPLCTCELLDVSTYVQVRYVRGDDAGCVVHETEARRAARLRRQAEREVAMRAAREAP